MVAKTSKTTLKPTRVGAAKKDLVNKQNAVKDLDMAYKQTADMSYDNYRYRRKNAVYRKIDAENKLEQETARAINYAKSNNKPKYGGASIPGRSLERTVKNQASGGMKKSDAKGTRVQKRK